MTLMKSQFNLRFTLQVSNHQRQKQKHDFGKQETNTHLRDGVRDLSDLLFCVCSVVLAALDYYHFVYLLFWRWWWIINGLCGNVLEIMRWSHGGQIREQDYREEGQLG